MPLSLLVLLQVIVAVNIEIWTCRVNTKTHKKVVVDQKATLGGETGIEATTKPQSPILENKKLTNKKMQYKFPVEFRPGE